MTKGWSMLCIYVDQVKNLCQVRQDLDMYVKLSTMLLKTPPTITRLNKSYCNDLIIINSMNKNSMYHYLLIISQEPHILK